MKRYLTAITGVLLMFQPVVALADTPLVSPSYRVDESFIGGGGLVEESSPSYKLGESIGDIAVGDSGSSNYSLNGGYTTTDDPYLAFTVNTTSINFGTLSPSVTRTGTATFSVQNYTSYGYSIYIAGTGLVHGSKTLTPLAANTGSAIGNEQFGINLAANTAPTSQGAAPSGGLGVAAANYGTANSYRYGIGEAIATAPKSSTLTNFTISFIVNMANSTPAGQYRGVQDLICVATY